MENDEEGSGRSEYSYIKWICNKDVKVFIYKNIYFLLLSFLFIQIRYF